MKKYYLHNGSEQQGPFDLNDLKSKNIQSDTPIWHEGLSNWTTVGMVDELRDIIKSVPPPFNTQPKNPPPPFNQEKTNVKNSQPEKRGGRGYYVWLTVLVALVIILFMMFKNNPNSIPGVKVQVSPPKPVLITSRGDDKNATLLDFKETVYATILNQGGAGSILVTFHLFQNGNDFVRTQTVYLKNSESRDLDVTFDEVKRLGGNMSYRVDLNAE